MYVTRGLLRSTLPGNEENVNFATNSTPRSRKKKSQQQSTSSATSCRGAVATSSITVCSTTRSTSSTTTSSSAKSKTSTTVAAAPRSASLSPSTTTAGGAGAAAAVAAAASCSGSYHGHGLFVDAKDSQERWNVGKVLDLDTKARKVLIHFVGWNSRYDEWLPVKCVAAHGKHTSNDRPVTDASKCWNGKRSLFTKRLPEKDPSSSFRSTSDAPAGVDATAKPQVVALKVEVPKEEASSSDHKKRESKNSKPSNSSKKKEKTAKAGSGANKSTGTRKHTRSSDTSMEPPEENATKRSRRKASPRIRVSGDVKVEQERATSVQMTSGVTEPVQADRITTTTPTKGPNDDTTPANAVQSGEPVDLELELDIEAESIEKKRPPRRKLQTKATKKMRLVTSQAESTNPSAKKPATRSGASTPVATRRSRRQQDNHDKQKQEQQVHQNVATSDEVLTNTSGDATGTTAMNETAGKPSSRSRRITTSEKDTCKVNGNKSEIDSALAQAPGTVTATTAPLTTAKDSSTTVIAAKTNAAGSANATQRGGRRQTTAPANRDKLRKQQHDALDANSMATKEKLAAIFRLRLQQQQQQPQQVQSDAPLAVSSRPQQTQSQSSKPSSSSSMSTVPVPVPAPTPTLSSNASMAMAMAMTSMTMAPGVVSSAMTTPNLLATSYAQQALYAASAGYFTNSSNGCLVTPMMAADAMDPRTLQTRLDALEHQKRLQQQHVQEYLEQIRLLREQNLQRLSRNHLFLDQSSELWQQQQQLALLQQQSQAQFTINQQGDLATTKSSILSAATVSSSGTSAATPVNEDKIPQTSTPQTNKEARNSIDNTASGSPSAASSAPDSPDSKADPGTDPSGRPPCAPTRGGGDSNSDRSGNATLQVAKPKPSTAQVNSQTGEILYEFVL